MPRQPPHAPSSPKKTQTGKLPAAADRTITEGPPVHADVLGGNSDEEWDDDETTHNRGSHPPKPSTSRRLSPTLMKVFQRRREQVGLSIKQVARLSGVDEEEYSRFEGTQGNHRLVYDHVIVLARVLGIPPQELPGLRVRPDTNVAAARLGEVERALRSGLVLTFEGTQGERLIGEVERVGSTPSFAVVIGDISLAPALPPKALLGFVAESRPQGGQMVVLRNRQSHFLSLRRFTPPSYSGLAQWQPAYVAGSGEWACLARLQVILPP